MGVGLMTAVDIVDGGSGKRSVTMITEGRNWMRDDVNRL